jgi:hypothetical protein
MLYSEIMHALYFGGIDDVVRILNMTVYSTNLNKSDDEMFVIHTGFSFLTHKGTEMEILAGFFTTSNNIVMIRQARSNWSYRQIPLINGVFIKIREKNHFLDWVDDRVCIKINEVGEDCNLSYVEYNNSDEIYNWAYDADNKDNFTIDTSRGVLNFPLSKKFKNPIYLNGRTFSSRQPIKNEDNNEPGRRQSFDDYLREDYGDDASDAYWNTD